MKNLIVLFLISFGVVPISMFIGWQLNEVINTNQSITEGVEEVLPNKVERSLDIYSIENLITADIEPGVLDIERKSFYETEDYLSYKFNFSFNPNPEKVHQKTTSGMINLPKGNSSRGIVLMIRGYVDQEIYQTGMGTSRAAEYFAENDYITIAPDFFGYANSDKEAENIFESRFQTYTTVLSLLKTLEQIINGDMEIALTGDVSRNELSKEIINGQLKNRKLFLWSHSNGGQIALTALAITEKAYPTTLWAPVTKPFPYSVLYYTDEAEDGGKLIRTELAKFESLYEAEKYSFTNYLNDIKAPLQIHQGTADDAIPYDWNQTFSNRLRSVYEEQNTNLDLNFYLYQGADHNLNPSWNTAIERDIKFFNSHI